MSSHAQPAQPGTPRSGLRLPRRTVRLRLTLLYGGLFLISGVVLLAITYLLVARQSGAVLPQFQAQIDGQNISVAMRAQMQVQEKAAAVAQLHQLLIQSGFALAIMAVASIGLGWLVAGRVLRPLRTITTAARQISASNLDQRLALDGPDDELTELGDTIDGLLGRLEGSFEAQRQFVANASHELRTPLARQRTLVEVALGAPGVTVRSLRATCERVLAAGEQQERLIEALLTLAHGQRGLERKESFDLAAVAGEVLPARHLEAQGRGLHVEALLGTAPASGDPRLAERLAANLVDNALRHNIAEGWVEVTTGTRAGRAVLSVANSGPVVPSAEVDRLFQPFQRLAADRVGHGDGHGLGLSIVQAIAAAHGATLSARPQPGGGLDVQVSFPATRA